MLILFILIFTSSLIAQVKEDSFEEIEDMKIDVATFRGEHIFQTPSTVSVIDRAMIEQYNFNSVVEAVNLIAGFSVGRTYLKRNQPTSRGILQDHYANKVLVLINGFPSWNAVTGEASLERINIHDVERLEVLKGPASVIYGSNAYSGAVNIVLRKSTVRNIESHLGIGNNQRFEAGGHYSYDDDNYSLFVSANSTDENGYDYKFIDEDKVTGHLKEYIKGSDFTLFSQFRNHTLLFNGYISHESFLGTAPKFSYGAGHDQISNGYLITYTFFHSIGDRIHLQYGLNYDWNHRDFSRSIDDSIRAKVNGVRLSQSICSIIDISDAIHMEIGGDWDNRTSISYQNYYVWQDSAKEENNLKDRNVIEYSLFSQIGYTQNLFRLFMGSRYTNNELFGTNTSFRGTLVYMINNRKSIKLIAGQSYRAPSLFELYFRTSKNTVFGDTNLKPENSNSIELVYLHSFEKFFIQALAYHSTYDNKIFRARKDWEVAGILYENVNVYSNGDIFSANGIELEVKYQNPKLINSFMNYNFIKGDNGDELDGSGHYNFKYIPQHSLSCGLAKKLEDFHISTIANYQSSIEGPEATIDPQFTVSLSFSYSHNKESTYFKHIVSIKNLMDTVTIIPEYVRRGGLNEIPFGYGRMILYTLKVML